MGLVNVNLGTAYGRVLLSVTMFHGTQTQFHAVSSCISQHQCSIHHCTWDHATQTWLHPDDIKPQWYIWQLASSFVHLILSFTLLFIMYPRWYILFIFCDSESAVYRKTPVEGTNLWVVRIAHTVMIGRENGKQIDSSVLCVMHLARYDERVMRSLATKMTVSLVEMDCVI